MDKKQIQESKEKLEKNKISIENELKNFAEKDKKIKGDWDTKYPKFSAGSSGSQQLEEAADEVEEYITLLPIEHNLELKLQKINLALTKIEKGAYGKCEQCGAEINEKKLRLYPETEFCGKCQK